MQFED